MCSHVLKFIVSFVIRNRLPHLSKQKCHPACPGLPWDRSVAQRRDLLFILRNIESEWKRHHPLCHPPRTAKGKVLDTSGPLNYKQPISG
jgi:hypothetical protein